MTIRKYYIHLQCSPANNSIVLEVLGACPSEETDSGSFNFTSDPRLHLPEDEMAWQQS